MLTSDYWGEETWCKLLLLSDEEEEKEGDGEGEGLILAAPLTRSARLLISSRS